MRTEKKRRSLRKQILRKKLSKNLTHRNLRKKIIREFWLRSAREGEFQCGFDILMNRCWKAGINISQVTSANDIKRCRLPDDRRPPVINEIESQIY